MTEKRCEQERAVSVENRGSCCGQQLNIMAAAFANYLGEGLSVDQLGLLSAFCSRWASRLTLSPPQGSFVQEMIII